VRNFFHATESAWQEKIVSKLGATTVQGSAAACVSQQRMAGIHGAPAPFSSQQIQGEAAVLMPLLCCSNRITSKADFASSLCWHEASSRRTTLGKGMLYLR